MSFVRLHVLVEGQTEESFVNDILGPELATRDVSVDAHSITTGRHHGQVYRGGLVRYGHLAKDLMLWMKQDQGADSWFTTMIDFYRLPADFPHVRKPSSTASVIDRIEGLEAALCMDITEQLNTLPVCGRLIPYIQLHEFEALFFSQPDAFAEAFPGDKTLVKEIATIRRQFATPEHIDDGPKTAPSKRILSLVDDYRKPVAGLLIAKRIGLAAMRAACPHFDRWVSRLLALASG